MIIEVISLVNRSFLFVKFKGVDLSKFWTGTYTAVGCFGIFVSFVLLIIRYKVSRLNGEFIESTVGVKS